MGSHTHALNLLHALLCSIQKKPGVQRMARRCGAEQRCHGAADRQWWGGGYPVVGYGGVGMGGMGMGHGVLVRGGTHEYRVNTGPILLNMANTCPIWLNMAQYGSI